MREVIILWVLAVVLIFLFLLVGCSERVVDAEGREREIARGDVRARIAEVLEEHEENVATMCRCTYTGFCHGCGMRMTSGGMKQGCGWGLQRCSGSQSCEKHEKVRITRDRITLNTGTVVFSYPEQSRVVMHQQITGNCE
jgi:hypothetical protein